MSSSTETGLPTIDVVIIGLNSAKTLQACLSSVRASRYPQDRIQVYYADGGSTDGSQALASAQGVTVLSVEASSPTPGRQRNVGWLAGTGEFVQFLDSDTVVDPDWLATAVAGMTDGVGAVCGDRRELHPERSLFNWIGDQEWNGKPGDCAAFGGDALVRRSALAETGGYDPDLIAGEDPECSYRIRQAGHRILRLAVPMTRHDLAMYTLKQYWRRAYRTGHAYAEVNTMHREFWASEVRRIGLRTVILALALVVLPGAVWFPWVALFSVAGVALFLRPRLLLVSFFQKDLGLTGPQARIYAWHATLVVVPQFLGMLRYYVGKVFSRPLTNRKVLKRSGVESAV